MVEDGRVRLGRLMGERRRQQRLSIRAAADLAGIDRATWSSAEGGLRTIATYNQAGVEHALGWEQGSVSRILTGGEPTLAPVRGTEAEDELVAEIERIKNLPLPPAARRAMLRALIDLHAEGAAGEPIERKTG